MKLIVIIRNGHENFTFGSIQEGSSNNLIFIPHKKVTGLKDVKKIRNFLTVKEFVNKQKNKDCFGRTLTAGCRTYYDERFYSGFLQKLKTWTGAHQIWIHKRSSI